MHDLEQRVSDPWIGVRIGDRYRMVERIGQGGMAAVYRAEHELLKKSVAVKLLHPELATSDEMVARFEREAVAAARLDHPNCVAVTDFGRTDQGQLFLVMEYLQGQSLSDVVGHGKRIPWQRAQDIARQILRGLARAHDMGIVHRDLKAQNIMLLGAGSPRELVKIIDFGIAKIFDGATGPEIQTRVGIVYGTADFVAPERLAGKAGTDPRSDLYSVGVLVYEMVTGSRPFHMKDPYDTVRRALTEPPRPPREVAPDAEIPVELEAVILRGLAKDPAERYQTARDFLAALDPGVLPETAPDVAIPVATAPRSARPVIVALAGAFVVLCGLAVVYAVGRPSQGSHPALLGTSLGAPGTATSPGALDRELARLVEAAATGATVEERQSAFDRLVALGYVDRVPWRDKLTRDLAQLPTCEERREAAAQLGKLADPKAIPALTEARLRSGNRCLEQTADESLASLGAPVGSPAATSAPAPPSQAPTRAKKVTRRGHF
jgi:tRNA A-37 threonylcarbamoyl transferase component Bud32